MKNYKLTIELVPQTAFYKNVRSEVTRTQWDIIRKKVYKEYDYKCGICSGKGKQHPVECHEIWEYDDNKHIQTLKGFIALCPSCHQVKHIGLSQIRGLKKECLKHLMFVNKITKKEANMQILETARIWEERSQYDWKCDMSFLSGEDI